MDSIVKGRDGGPARPACTSAFIYEIALRGGLGKCTSVLRRVRRKSNFHGRGKLSGVGKPTVIMTGPVPINKQTLKKAARQKKARGICRGGKKAEEQRRKKDAERLEIERALGQ